MVNFSTESMNKADVCASPVARFFGMLRLNPWSFWMVSLVPLCELTPLTMTDCQELGRGTSTFVRVSPALGVFSFLMLNISRMGWLLLGYECMSSSRQLRLSLSHTGCTSPLGYAYTQPFMFRYTLFLSHRRLCISSEYPQYAHANNGG